MFRALHLVSTKILAVETTQVCLLILEYLKDITADAFKSPFYLHKKAPSYLWNFLQYVIANRN